VSVFLDRPPQFLSVFRSFSTVSEHCSGSSVTVSVTMVALPQVPSVIVDRLPRFLSIIVDRLPQFLSVILDLLPQFLSQWLLCHRFRVLL
jgi:hypothetical protein